MGKFTLRRVLAPPKQWTPAQKPELGPIVNINADGSRFSDQMRDAIAAAIATGVDDMMRQMGVSGGAMRREAERLLANVAADNQSRTVLDHYGLPSRPQQYGPDLGRVPLIHYTNALRNQEIIFADDNHVRFMTNTTHRLARERGRRVDSFYMMYAFLCAMLAGLDEPNRRARRWAWDETLNCCPSTVHRRIEPSQGFMLEVLRDHGRAATVRE